MKVHGKHEYDSIPTVNSGDKLIGVEVTAANPLVTNDDSQGYYIGYIWAAATSGNTYVCDDASTGAAVWTQINGPGVTDTDAIHDNVAAEISAVTEKVTPVVTDLLLIEDSAAANVKKKIQIGNLPNPMTLAETISGTDTYTATPTTAWTSYTTGEGIFCLFTNANTSATPTLNVSGLGVKTIQRNGSLGLNVGDIKAGQPYWAVYDGTDFQLSGNIATDWQPNSVPLGGILTSGASFFINGGAGIYLSMSGSADDAFYFNDSLNKSDVTYDGSDLALKLHCRLSTNGGGGDTIGLILDYAIVKDGDNTTTTVTNVAQVNTDVSTEVADEMFDITMSTMTGVATADTIMISVTRNATGAASDGYAGAFEIIGMEFVKV